MNEGIEKPKPEDHNYESTITGEDLAADFAKDPEMHGHHHVENLREHDMLFERIEELEEAQIQLLKRIENLGG